MSTPLTPQGICDSFTAKGITTQEQFAVFVDYATTQVALNSANAAITSAQATAAKANDDATAAISEAQARRDALIAHLASLGTG